MTAGLCFTWAPGAADQLETINSQIVQYIEVLLALGGVLALAYVTLRIGLPRFFGLHVPGTNGPIRVVARYPLEPKKSLYLVKAGTQVFLVGTSENQVAYLTAIADENAAGILEAASNPELPRKDFRHLLERFQRRGES